MTHITIPASIDEAITSLTSLDGLLTAKEWEKAAIVWAFTRDGGPGEGGPGRQRSESTTLLPRDFAKLGIAGLRSDQTVRRYRQAWQAAIDASLAREVHPGQVTELPGMAWADAYVSERTEKGRKGSLEIPVTSDAAMVAWFEANREQAQRVARAAAGVLDPGTKAGLTDDLIDELPPDLQAEAVGKWSMPPGMPDGQWSMPPAQQTPAQQAEVVRGLLTNPAVADAAFNRPDQSAPHSETRQILGNIGQARQDAERQRLADLHDRRHPEAGETDNRIGEVGAKLELDEATLAYKTAARRFAQAISAALPQAGPYSRATGPLSFAELVAETTAEHTMAGRVLSILADYVNSEGAGLDAELARILAGE